MTYIFIIKTRMGWKRWDSGPTREVNEEEKEEEKKENDEEVVMEAIKI